MSLRRLKPTTPSGRHTIKVDRKDIYKGRPVKSLVAAVSNNAGRNNTGRITVRHHQGRGRRQYRLVDFKRDNFGVKGTVDRIEYDPNRSAHIALIKYENGDWRYILATSNMKIGDVVENGENAEIREGNALPMKKIPQGSLICAIETTIGKGAVMARSAGAYAQIQGFEKGYAILKIPSGELRVVREECYATIGIASNVEKKNEKLGKAGRSRWKGTRPTVRGVAMSYKHPHGAGQGKKGKSTVGGIAKDFWGNRVGTRTRKNKVTNKYIIRRRENKSGRKFKKYKTII